MQHQALPPTQRYHLDPLPSSARRSRLTTLQFFRLNISSDDPPGSPNILEIGLRPSDNIEGDFVTTTSESIRVSGVFRSTAIFFFGIEPHGLPFLTAAKCPTSIPTPSTFRDALVQAIQTGMIQHVEIAYPNFADLSYGEYLEGIVKGGAGEEVTVRRQQYRSIGDGRRAYRFTAALGGDSIEREVHFNVRLSMIGKGCFFPPGILELCIARESEWTLAIRPSPTRSLPLQTNRILFFQLLPPIDLSILHRSVFNSSLLYLLVLALVHHPRT